MPYKYNGLKQEVQVLFDVREHVLQLLSQYLKNPIPNTFMKI